MIWMGQRGGGIGGVILGAGMSRRMGEPKLLLSLSGKSLIQHTVERVVEHPLSPICLVAGDYVAEIRKQLNKFTGIDIIYNRDFAQGMSTSLKYGIRKMQGLADAAIIFLADQPFLAKDVVQSLIDIYEREKENGILIVRPSYQGVLGHPVLIDKSIFHEFYAITGDIGGKHILKKYRQQARIISFENPIWGKDIDTPEDFTEIRKYSEN